MLGWLLFLDDQPPVAQRIECGDSDRGGSRGCGEEELLGEKELFPYFQLLRDGLRKLPGFATRDMFRESEQEKELVRGR